MPFPLLALGGMAGGAAGVGGAVGGGGAIGGMAGGAGAAGGMGGAAKMAGGMGGAAKMAGGMGGGGGKGGGGGGFMDKISGADPLNKTLAIIPELYKFGLGIKQMKQAKQLERSTRRPTYEIPKAQTEALGLARNMAQDVRMPGQNIMEEQMGVGFANMARGVSESSTSQSGKLAAMVAGNANLQDQQANMGVQAAQMQVQKLQNLQSALYTHAEQQKAKRDWEVTQPYLNAMAKISQLRNSGPQNIYSGMKGVAGGLMSGGGKKTGDSGSPQAPAGKAEQSQMNPAQLQNMWKLMQGSTKLFK